VKGDLPCDPRGLIAEAYRIDGIGPAECRSIFLDWALGLPEGAGRTEIRALLDRYGEAQPDHPMTAVLREGLEQAEASPRRRGGRSGRRDDADRGRFED
jgi:hypothetical protein